jgi:hypothetical protein
MTMSATGAGLAASPLWQAGRFRDLQGLVAASSLDALLLVAGQDGAFNAGSAQALNWLRGRSGRSVMEGLGLGFGADRDDAGPQGREGSWEEVASEAVLVIQPSAVAAYLPCPAAVTELRACLAPSGGGLASLRLFCPTLAERDDPDAAEEAKCGAMVQMLRGVRSLGVLLGVPPPGEAAPTLPRQAVPAGTLVGAGTPQLAGVERLTPERAMVLERWPLLMAYGLEGVGRPGFFTQAFKVRRCSCSGYSSLQSLRGLSSAVSIGNICVGRPKGRLFGSH